MLSIPTIRIFGVVPTLYRVVVPTITLATLFIYIKDKRKILENKLLKIFVFVMFFWIIWSIPSMILSEFSVFQDACKDIMFLLLGIGTVICIVCNCSDFDEYKFILNLIKVFISILICFSLFEIVFDFHLYLSKLYSSNMLNRIKDDFLGFFLLPKISPSTTIFYGINDYSAFLGTFLPLFFYDGQATKKINIWNISVFFAGLFIIYVNDANIVLIAQVISFAVYLLLNKKDRIITAIIALISGLSHLFLFNVIVKLLSKVKFVFYNLYNPAVESLENTEVIAEKITTVIKVQVQNASGGSGSLFARLTMYIDSFKALVKSHFLGIGPASFENYFEKYKSQSGLVNPHNWWLELLTQYGVFVFISYLLFIIFEYISLVKLYLKTNDNIISKIICVCTSFVICCISPSSFLGYSYQWVVIALGLVALNTKNR